MGVWDSLNPAVRPDLDAKLNPLKKVPDTMFEHAGASSRGLVLDVTGNAQNMAHIGLLNRNLGFAVELNYSTKSLPRMANWQHFGPGGTYVSALDPFSGSLFGKAQDPPPPGGAVARRRREQEIRDECYCSPGGSRHQRTARARRRPRTCPPLTPPKPKMINHSRPARIAVWRAGRSGERRFRGGARLTARRAGIPAGMRAIVRATRCRHEWRHGTQECVRHVGNLRHEGRVGARERARHVGSLREKYEPAP